MSILEFYQHNFMVNLISIQLRMLFGELGHCQFLSYVFYLFSVFQGATFASQRGGMRADGGVACGCFRMLIQKKIGGL
jgi:hypothetical protein